MRERCANHACTFTAAVSAPVRVGVRRTAPRVSTGEIRAADQSDSAQRQYCREARRLRASLAGDPARLIRQLRELSRQRDRQTPSGRYAPAHIIGRSHADIFRDVPREAIDIDSPAEQFARRVEHSLLQQPDGYLIRYSRRLAFLRDAERQGLDRFQANLIIAAAQDRARQNPAINIARCATETPGAPMKGASRRLYAFIAAAVAIESLILLTVLHII